MGNLLKPLGFGKIVKHFVTTLQGSFHFVERTEIVPSQSNHVLCVGLLQKGAPEFIAVVRMAIDQLIVYSWQAVIYDHINPFSKTPEAEVKYPHILIWIIWNPVLFLNIWNHLKCPKKQRITPSIEAGNISRLTDKMDPLKN